MNHQDISGGNAEPVQSRRNLVFQNRRTCFGFSQPAPQKNLRKF